jgi:hypothetical protein
LVVYKVGDANIETVNSGGTNYWKIDGVNGTGGYSINNKLSQTGDNAYVFVFMIVLFLILILKNNSLQKKTKIIKNVSFSISLVSDGYVND